LKVPVSWEGERYSRPSAPIMIASLPATSSCVRTHTHTHTHDYLRADIFLMPPKLQTRSHTRHTRYIPYAAKTKNTIAQQYRTNDDTHCHAAMTSLHSQRSIMYRLRRMAQLAQKPSAHMQKAPRQFSLATLHRPYCHPHAMHAMSTRK
jgi:hypothetical protein